jgi:hypothetical protein
MAEEQGLQEEYCERRCDDRTHARDQRQRRGQAQVTRRSDHRHRDREQGGREQHRGPSGPERPSVRRAGGRGQEGPPDPRHGDDHEHRGQGGGENAFREVH